MTTANNIQVNLEKVADIKKRNPTVKHLYIRRVGVDGLVIDIPVDHAEATIKRHPQWEIVSSSKEMDDEVEALFKEPEISSEAKEFEDRMKEKGMLDEVITVPPKPSEIIAPPKKRGRPKKNAS